MSAEKGFFTATALCNALGLETEKSRAQAVTALRDFLKRNELLLIRYEEKRNRRQPAALYQYNPRWHSKRESKSTKKIYKAMYVQGIFSGSDLVRLSEAFRTRVDEAIRRLRKEGIISRVGRRRCVNSTSVENLYNIPDRDRFRREVMG